MPEAGGNNGTSQRSADQALGQLTLDLLKTGAAISHLAGLVFCRSLHLSEVLAQTGQLVQATGLLFSNTLYSALQLGRTDQIADLFLVDKAAGNGTTALQLAVARPFGTAEDQHGAGLIHRPPGGTQGSSIELLQGGELGRQGSSALAALQALTLEGCQFAAQLPALILQTTAVEHSEHLPGTNLLVGPYRDSLDTAPQQALNLGVLAGGPYQTRGANRLMERPEHPSHRTDAHGSQKLPAKPAQRSGEIGKHILGAGGQQQRRQLIGHDADPAG